MAWSFHTIHEGKKFADIQRQPLDRASLSIALSYLMADWVDKTDIYKMATLPGLSDMVCDLAIKHCKDMQEKQTKDIALLSKVLAALIGILWGFILSCFFGVL